MLETDDDEATGSGRSQRKQKKTFSDVEVDNSNYWLMRSYMGYPEDSRLKPKGENLW